MIWVAHNVIQKTANGPRERMITYHFFSDLPNSPDYHEGIDAIRKAMRGCTEKAPVYSPVAPLVHPGAGTNTNRRPSFSSSVVIMNVPPTKEQLVYMRRLRDSLSGDAHISFRYTLLSSASSYLPHWSYTISFDYPHAPPEAYIKEEKRSSGWW